MVRVRVDHNHNPKVPEFSGRRSEDYQNSIQLTLVKSPRTSADHMTTIDGCGHLTNHQSLAMRLEHLQ